MKVPKKLRFPAAFLRRLQDLRTVSGTNAEGEKLEGTLGVIILHQIVMGLDVSLGFQSTKRFKSTGLESRPWDVAPPPPKVKNCYILKNCLILKFANYSQTLLHCRMFYLGSFLVDGVNRVHAV